MKVHKVRAPGDTSVQVETCEKYAIKIGACAYGIHTGAPGDR